MGEGATRFGEHLSLTGDQRINEYHADLVAKTEKTCTEIIGKGRNFWYNHERVFKERRETGC